MDIAFIKWMCEKAKWEYLKEKDGYSWVRLECGSTISTSFIMKSSIYYPLLLQRAIEGINRAHRNFSDRYPIIHIECYYIKEIEKKIYGEYVEEFNIDSFDSIDQAKEAALRYIYEHEMK